ncbi:AlbA family DNA-binding domain-containing protein [Arenibacter troitsensis]|uniref:Putative DNA-binding domain-containing protein n=1 Tax=Arenibacter troitsensis TaxID=188872 RepID=A0A1X7IXA5_9FLAO|nr:ATP-binding protein [Arenibacter troitsensis]SMG19545.1 Putative DNA-binding domain-containing protein [Arenibacter troitsensis]
MNSLLDKTDISETDIKQLIELKIEESINLDFKRHQSLCLTEKSKAEIAKDVSAFANSAGGFIVYGIAEENHVASGYSFIDGNIITKEWIEQVIQSRIQRKIEGLRIYPVRINQEIEKTVYVVRIPESTLAPHMTSNKKFYRRFNFESVQMEEYEIRNLYNRKEMTSLEINNITTSTDTYIENRDGSEEIIFYRLGFQIENIGKSVEKYCKLFIDISFRDYVFKWYDKHGSQPNHSLLNNNLANISFSNPSPIFPGEIMTMADFEFGLPLSKLDSIIELEYLKLKLIYSNGLDEMEVKLKTIIKTNT